MGITVAFTARGNRARQVHPALVPGLVFVVIVILSGCGTNTTKTPTTTTNPSPSPTPTPTPTQPTPPPIPPSNPSTPPVPITWSPQSSPLPAPPATPPPAGSNDFPLTISSPADGSTVTSPVTVVASATPTNPIFFMRVYVDQLAVYFTFTNSINAQIFIAPGAHKLEVMAEDNQGYISATILNLTVSSQSQTTISSIQDMSGWQNCSALYPPARDGQDRFAPRE